MNILTKRKAEFFCGPVVKNPACHCSCSGCCCVMGLIPGAGTCTCRGQKKKAKSYCTLGKWAKKCTNIYNR